MDIKDRIKSLHGPRERAKFAESVGFSASYLSDVEKGRSKPSRALLEAISKKHNVSIDWLLTGKGPKELFFVREAAVAYEATAAVNIISPSDYKKLLQDQPEAEAYIPIPLISEPAAAGDPLIINENDIEGFAVIYRKWVKPGHKYRCLRVRGDSMRPVICDGFIVAIDLNENDPRKLLRQIVAVRHEGGVTIKCLLMDEKNYILFPYNTEEYNPITIPLTAPNPIIGKVAWWWGRAK